MSMTERTADFYTLVKQPDKQGKNEIADRGIEPHAEAGPHGV